MSHHPKLREISTLVEEILGLSFPGNRWDDLERGVLSTSRELGFGDSIDNFATWLTGRNFDARQLDILAGHLTVGETYFFRERNSLDVFQKHIIPEILTERFGKHQYINIWSAGCCSGEEPYTLAMLLLETMPDITKWKITIVATDLNPLFLKKAREGIYSAWSFRETPKDLQSRYFNKVGNKWQIDEKIREMVNFRQLNLAEPCFPSQLPLQQPPDVIFCRNVLMYFSPELIHQVGRNFYHVLSNQGWFITSPVELSDVLFPQFTKVNFDKSIVYRKTTAKHQVDRSLLSISDPVGLSKGLNIKSKNREIPKTAVTKLSPKAFDEPKVMPLEAAEHLYRKKQYAECANLCRSELAKSAGKYALQMLLARSCANTGNRDEALKLCEEMISFDRLNAEIYYLKATILAEMHESDEALNVLKKGIYINPDHLLSHLLMAEILRRSGNDNGARIHFKNVKKILSGLENNVVLEETDGLTVGRIIEMIGSQ